jgi:hypothetical protein
MSTRSRLEEILRHSVLITSRYPGAALPRGMLIPAPVLRIKPLAMIEQAMVFSGEPGRKP